MKEELSFRTKTGNLLASPVAQWTVITGFTLLTLWVDNLAYFLGLSYILLLVWSKKWDWNLIGMYRPKSWRQVWIQAFLFSILIILLVDIIITPFIEYFTGIPIDISSLDGIRGNFISYLIFILFMWVIAAFGEEFVYRGLLVQRLGTLLGNTNAAYWIAVLGSSVLFGLAHKYQGISGMITTGIVGFIFGSIYVRSKNRLWLTILTHGIYDSILITLIYLDLDGYVFDFFKNMF